MRVKLAQISNHTKRSIVYRQGLRVTRICSEKAYEGDEVMVPQAGLSENIVDQELGKVKSSESSRRTNKKDKGVCLVVTYHPLQDFS